MHLSAFTPVRPLKRSGSGLQLPVGCKICVCGSPGFNRPASLDPEPRHVVTDEVEYVPTCPVYSTPEPDECEGSCRLGTPCPCCGGDTSSVCTRCGADGCMEFEGCRCDCRMCNYDATTCFGEDNSCACDYKDKSILPRRTLRRIASFQAVARGVRVRSKRVSDEPAQKRTRYNTPVSNSYAAALEKGEVIYIE